MNPFSSRNTLLHIASAKGELQVVRVLLDVGADPEVVNEYDHPPLHYAITHDRTEVIRLLLASGAKVESVNDPLHMAVRGADSKPEIVNLLLSAGADPFQPDVLGHYPIRDARRECRKLLNSVMMSQPNKMRTYLGY